MEGISEMSSSSKKFDTISNPEKVYKKVTPKKDEPLLSILDPTVKKAPTKEKKNWFRWGKKNQNNEARAEKVKKNPKDKLIKPHHKKIAAWSVIVAILLFVIVLLGGSAYAHQSIYKNKVYPGVVVWGEPVGGKSMTQVQELVTKKIQDYKLTLSGPDQKYVANSSDLGVIFNSETMALSAYSKGRTGSFWDNYWTRLKLLVTNIKWQPIQTAFRTNELAISPSYQMDDKKLNEYLTKIATNIHIEAKDSEVKINNGNTELAPAIYGRDVQTEILAKQVKDNIALFKPSEIKVSTTTVKPAIVDESAKEVVVQAQSVMSRPVTLTYQGQTFTPNKETVASWINFVKPAGSQNYTLIVDPAKMKNYFSFLSGKINVYPVTRKVQVENGAKENILQEGKDGLLMDEAALGKSIAEILPVQPSVTLTIPMYVAKFKTEFNQVLVANWDKYIEITLSTQTMIAYLKGGQAVGSWKVTTGNQYHPTPTGTWLVHGKSAITRMTGGTPGVDYYDLPNVHWVTWFKGGGYSIHEAYWRSSFGGMDYTWNGSHGCVNSPIGVAQFIYDWAPVGTPVIVHY